MPNPVPITTKMMMKRDVMKRVKKLTMKSMTSGTSNPPQIPPQQRKITTIVKTIEEAEPNALPAYSPQTPDPARSNSAYQKCRTRMFSESTVGCYDDAVHNTPQ
jgi:hypothetical protein